MRYEGRDGDVGGRSMIVWLTEPVLLAEDLPRLDGRGDRPRAHVLGYDRGVTPPAWIAERAAAPA